MAHPGNAVFVSADGLASFDQYGRKLDSLGNVARGDYQNAYGAGAEPIQQQAPPPQYQPMPTNPQASAPPMQASQINPALLAWLPPDNQWAPMSAQEAWRAWQQQAQQAQPMQGYMSQW